MIEYFRKNEVSGFGDSKLLEKHNRKMINLLLELGEICNNNNIEIEHTFQINSIREKSNNFNYDKFFLTNDIFRAKRYACNGIGELLNAIVDCYNALINYGVEYKIKDEELQELIGQFKNIKKENCKPLIVIFNDLNWCNIPYFEDGKKVNVEILLRSFFYNHMRQDSFIYFGKVIPYDNAIIAPIEESDNVVKKLYNELYTEHKVSLYDNLKDSLKRKFDLIIDDYDSEMSEENKNLLITMVITSKSIEEVFKKLEKSYGILKLMLVREVAELILDIFK